MILAKQVIAITGCMLLSLVCAYPPMEISNLTSRSQLHNFPVKHSTYSANIADYEPEIDKLQGIPEHSEQRDKRNDHIVNHTRANNDVNNNYFSSQLNERIAPAEHEFDWPRFVIYLLEVLRIDMEEKQKEINNDIRVLFNYDSNSSLLQIFRKALSDVENIDSSLQSVHANLKNVSAQQHDRYVKSEKSLEQLKTLTVKKFHDTQEHLENSMNSVNVSVTENTKFYRNTTRLALKTIDSSLRNTTKLVDNLVVSIQKMRVEIGQKIDELPVRIENLLLQSEILDAVTEMVTSLNHLSTHNGHFFQQNETLQLRENDLSDKENALKDNEDLIKQRKLEVINQRARIRLEKEELDELNIYLHRRQKKLDDQEKDLKKEEAVVESKEQEINRYWKELQSIQLHLEKDKVDLHKQETDLELKQNDLKKLQADLEEEKNRLAQEADDLNMDQMKIENQRSVSQIPKAKLNQKEDELKKKRDELDEREVYLEEQMKYLKSNEREINNERNKLRRREEELKKKLKDVDDIKTNLDNVSDIFPNISDYLRMSQEDLKKQQEDVNNQHKESDQKKQQLKNLWIQLEAEIKQLNEGNATIEKTLVTNNTIDIREEMSRLIAELANKIPTTQDPSISEQIVEISNEVSLLDLENGEALDKLGMLMECFGKILDNLGPMLPGLGTANLFKEIGTMFKQHSNIRRKGRT